MAEYVYREFLRISADFSLIEEGRYWQPQMAEPPKPREGMLANADGVSWDPGYGAGFYQYLAGVWQKMPNAGEALLTNLYLSGFLVFDKAAGKGIKVDLAAPTYTWKDLEGPIQPKATGAGSPIWKTFRGNIKEWAFGVNDIVDLKYHMPHGWVPGSDIYIHVHWSHNGTAISGSMVLTYRWTYQKGHNQGVYPADVSFVQTVSTPNIATYPRYAPIISEIQFSKAVPSANEIDTDSLEPDGLIKLSLIVTTKPTITGGDLFIEYVDIHYQSTCVGTKQKAPNFYV
jgi:hypothetical protein